MKIAVSNIGWTNEEEIKAAVLLQELGITSVEIAPTKQWEDLSHVPSTGLGAYIDFWRSYDIQIVAFQSMLFTRPDLKLFESEENRNETLAYLKSSIDLAAAMGVRRMVFGSPKNRQRGSLSLERAEAIAFEFFSALGAYADSRGVIFCIEPNATQYACDFITTADEGAALVRKVASPGFGLHLDMGCMTLAGDEISESILSSADILKHFHISSPMLEAVNDSAGVDHAAASRALKDGGYEGYVSIEMKPAVNNLDRVEQAVRLAQNRYAGID